MQKGDLPSGCLGKENIKPYGLNMGDKAQYVKKTQVGTGLNKEASSKTDRANTTKLAQCEHLVVSGTINQVGSAEVTPRNPKKKTQQVT